ncbi:hypothetical protein CsSME_00014501 [Camellia sinensis var. sinensis]
MNRVKTEVNEQKKLFSQDTLHVFPPKNPMISRIRSNSTCRNYQVGSGSASKKKAPHIGNKKSKHGGGKQVDGKRVAQLFLSKVAQEEIIKCEFHVLCRKLRTKPPPSSTPYTVKSDPPLKNMRGTAKTTSILL